VVAIGPPAEDFKPSVDFGEGAKAKGLWQCVRAAGRPYVRPTRSFSEMAPRAKTRSGYRQVDSNSKTRNGLTEKLLITAPTPRILFPSPQRGIGQRVVKPIQCTEWLLRSSSCF
jgi:hypothetical protein